MTLSVRVWQPLLTPHQSHTLAALRDALDGRLDVVVDRLGDPVREAQGWRLGGDDLMVEHLPEQGWRARVRELLADVSTVHLFGSPFERSRLNRALVLAARMRRRAFLISEPYCPIAVGYHSPQPTRSDVAKAALRPLLYRAYGGLLARRLSGVFAISAAAVAQYRRIGFAPSRVLPFGYFVPPSEHRDVPERRQLTGPLRVAYVGSFIARKGVDTLLAAAATEHVAVDLFGSGWRERPLPANVRYGGALPFGEVHQALAGYDLVVVPSLFDGWAVVVNEAIQAGVPVIASHAVGAAAMLAKWHAGAVFPAGDAAALASLLRWAASDPAVLARWRGGAAKLAPLLAPQVAARYLRDGIEAVLEDRAPPPCPWYDA